MEYVYATLTLNETGQEINERNLTAVLEAAGTDVIESRIKAIVAALEDLDLDEIGAESGIAPAPPMDFEAVSEIQSEVSDPAAAGTGEGSASTSDVSDDDPLLDDADDGDQDDASPSDEQEAAEEDDDVTPVAGDGGTTDADEGASSDESEAA